MIYVFDTSSFLVLKNFYPSRFPSVWSGMDHLIEAQRLVSVREVLNELDSYNDQDFIQEWAKAHKPLFLTPGREELLMVSKIFQVEHFKALISRQSILKGTPVADPFVIAAAHVKKGIVVTQETKQPNAAKIPNICDHFGVEYVNLEGFMEKEGWAF